MNERQLYLEPDRLEIDRLIERIRKDPPGIQSRRLLIAQYSACGWFADAERQARKILSFEPSDRAAKEFLKGLGEASGSNTGKSEQHKPDNQFERREDRRHKKSQWQGPSLTKVNSLPAIANLRIDSRDNASTSTAGRPPPVHRTHSIAPKPPMSIRNLARAVSATSRDSRAKALDLVCEDFQDVAAHVCGSRSWKSPDVKHEAVRQALIERTKDVKTFLPGDLQQLIAKAFMHVEHEVLHRDYVNRETMYGDMVSEIPRTRFWVSEDGYAWDMNELARAIDSNRGVMRNPLSKHMFSPEDVRAIVQHPLGERLKALEVNQRELRRGVRAETVEMLGRLSETLLRDDEEIGFVPSRRAVEAFRAYLATLPTAEQRAIDMLWVPAMDHHTGMGFDMSIGEALEDALANRVCFHKVGDLLGQAARYLRR